MQDSPILEDTYLRNWFADVRTTTGQAEALFAELSRKQKTWQPAPKVWSISECFDHLVITADLYLSPLEEAIGRVRAVSGGSRDAGERRDTGERPSFRARWLQRKFISTIGPQSRRKVKTFKIFQRLEADIDPSRVEEEFLNRQARLGELMRKADGCDLNGGKVYSPLTRLLSFTVGETLWLLTAHDQRHLLQAQRLVKTEGFPAG